MAAAKIKKGDSVVVLSGKDKGRTGTVTKVLPKDGKVVVDGINVAARHRKPSATRPQGEMENSFQQARNLDAAFEASACAGPVLLVDDVSDSGWTLAVASAILRQAGAGPVFPVVLAAAR